MFVKKEITYGYTKDRNKHIMAYQARDLRVCAPTLQPRGGRRSTNDDDNGNKHKTCIYIYIYICMYTHNMYI